MNVLIHIATGFGVAVAVTDTKKVKTTKDIVKISFVGLFISIVFHALLDYVPHCYPINLKIDFIVGLLVLILLAYFCAKNFRPIMICCLIGSVLPDIVDLLPSILNNQLGLKLPIYENIFPWHWKEYSGSIYKSNCLVSNINIGLILLSVIGVLIMRKTDLKVLYKRSGSRQKNENDK